MEIRMMATKKLRNKYYKNYLVATILTDKSDNQTIQYEKDLAVR